MTKEEVMAFGVPEEKYRSFQAVYNREINERAAKKRMEADEIQSYRAAIDAVLALLTRSDTLHRILHFAFKAFFEEV